MVSRNALAAFAPLAKQLDAFSIGHDRFFDSLLNAELTEVKYPPYNILKTDDTHYVIELAVAGFSKSELDLEVEGDKLTIKGHVAGEEDGLDYVHRGIAKRAFTRVFTIAEHVQVMDADIVDGLLTIRLERIVPEEKKPRKIQLGNTTKAEPELLTEDC